MTNSNLVWLGACVLAVVAIVWWAVAASPGAPGELTTVADPSTLPGISTDMLATSTEQASTWPIELSHLAERLDSEGIPHSNMEGQVLHIHQHLDLFVHGKSVGVPTNIGIHQAAGWLGAIHVHDTSGVIHVESPFEATYTLGQVFDTWGVRFTSSCIGGYCTDETNTLKVYVNGKLYEGDPRTLALDGHQVIVVVYGSAAEAPAIPTTYNFAPGQ